LCIELSGSGEVGFVKFIDDVTRVGAVSFWFPSVVVIGITGPFD